MKRYFIFRLFSGAALLFLGAELSFAATFNIAHNDNTAFRNAITTSNSNNQDDVINLAAGGTYTFVNADNNVAGIGPNALPAIGPDSGHTLTINGNGSIITRSNASPDFRFLGIVSGASITINNVTFSNGLLAPADNNPFGGAIDANYALVSINNCTFTGNNAVVGGAIYAFGVNALHPAVGIALSGCTLYGNSAQDGGAVEVNGATGGTATLSAINCTFTGNSALSHVSAGGTALEVNGSNNGTAIAAFTSCTIVNETVSNDNGSITFANCILQPPPDGVAFLNGTGTYGSDGYNLGVGFGFSNTGDQNVSNAFLDARGLRNNGGPTMTIGLFNGSRAIDKGKAFGLTTDQRGFSRPVDLSGVANAPGGDGSDIGAFEASDPTQQNPLVVNTTDDHDDGVCGATDCTLREAINYANGFNGSNAISFSPGLAGTIMLQAPLGGLVLSNGAVISGPGARQLSVSGNHQIQVFNLLQNTTISGLTIRDGAIASVGGAAIDNQAHLTLLKCELIGNSITAANGAGLGSSGGAAHGGAILNLGTLDVDKCLFSSNSATGGNGAGNNAVSGSGGSGGVGQGGAIYNSSGATANLTNITFYTNTATGGTGGSDAVGSGGTGGNGDGGGLCNAGTMTLTSCTIGDNSGSGGAGGSGRFGITATPGTGRGGIASLSGATTTMFDSISGANNRNNAGGTDVDGAFTSGGHNLIGSIDHSTGFPVTGDITGTDASYVSPFLLFPPVNNGGPTDTVKFSGNSPAIHGANPATAEERDQRGYIRDYAPDIGAYDTNGTLLRLSALYKQGLSLIMNVEVVQGHVYQFERKLNLTDANWAMFNGFTARNDDTEQFNASLVGLDKAFYHVIVVQ